MEGRLDILYIASGTTAGLRVADESMLKALGRCGVQTASVTPDFGLPFGLHNTLRGRLLATDLHGCLVLRRAARRALVNRPRAIVYASTHAALLQGEPPGIKVAIRFDTPVTLSRKGARFAVEHRLERRRFREARMLLPTGIEVTDEVGRLLPNETDVVPLPIPIARFPIVQEREPMVVTYAAPPGKKGLDLVVRAWASAPVDGRRLVITGISREVGLRHLYRHGLEEPPETEWAGLLSSAEFRALTRRAEIYLAGSRYENYGIAQLEALADGALLVTVPSAGPFAALSVARQLEPATVAASMSGDGLARALEAALLIDEAKRRLYREQAQRLLEFHSEAELVERLNRRVLPALLG